ncbi:MAG: GTP cyclohydrolase II [Calothrix sp. SM1_5_4]|nr:GTP cyclohydrolase II [Calothrix sp. SM1_5_4]
MMPVKIDETVTIQTKFGPCEAITFTGLADKKEHIVFAFGDWRRLKIPNVRLHSECLTGDVFASERCDCGPQLQEAIARFSSSGGLIVYLRQEGRGIGLLNKIKAYRLQDQGYDTYEANRQLGFEADQRDFKIAGEMLTALGITAVNLLSNNPRKVEGLERNGIQVAERMKTRTHLSRGNYHYLLTKQDQGGHDSLDVPHLKAAK